MAHIHTHTHAHTPAIPKSTKQKVRSTRLSVIIAKDLKMLRTRILTPGRKFADLSCVCVCM
jgi:hypothetical protein